MLVKCVDDRPHDSYNDNRFLVKENVYQVIKDDGYSYIVEGSHLNWNHRRFIKLDDNVCPQCGGKHP
jgi:hypothetical protein